MANERLTDEQWGVLGYAHSPVKLLDGTWWHSNELWSEYYGPFLTYEEALIALGRYLAYIEGPNLTTTVNTHHSEDLHVTS